MAAARAVLYDTTTWRHQTLALTYDPHGIAFIHNGARFVTLSYLDTGGRVDLWDTATLQPVGEPLTLTTDDNYSAEANERGTKVVFGSFQGVTPVLYVSPTSWQRTACRLAGRNLTRCRMGAVLPRPGLPRDMPTVARQSLTRTGIRYGEPLAVLRCPNRTTPR